MTGPRFLLLVLVLVAGTTAAVLYTNRLYDRKSEELLRAMGRDVEPPPPRPTSRGASRPSTRPVLRNEETAVVRARDGTRIVSVRANGEFFRLPSGPEERGPVVRGVIGRAVAADMKRAAPAPETLKTLTGVNLRTDALPERATVDVVPIESDAPATVTAWPRRTTIPDAGGTIDVPLVDADARGLVLSLRPGAIVRRGDRGWRVERVELLAP